MTASVPWSVNAVEPETWATARDAARRTGVSVGEWLEFAIRESAGESVRPRGRGHGQAPSDAIERRLDDIADRLDNFVRNGREPAPVPARGRGDDATLAASIDTLNERIESLIRDMRATDRNGPAEVRSAIQRLDDRIENLISRGRLSGAGATPELERKLSAIESTIEAMSRRLEHENARFAHSPVPPTVAELDAAIADIMVRQAVLDGVPSPQEFHRRYSSAPDLGGLEHQLKIMADEMQALRRSGVQAETVDALRRDVSDLAGKLADLAPRRSLEAIEGAVEALVRRIDRGAGGVSDPTNSEVIQALHDIRTALAEVRPAESFISVERDLHQLSEKLDSLNAQGIDGVSVARLHAQTAEIRDLLANALPSDVLKALVEQIEILVRKFEGTVAPADSTLIDVVAALDRRIESLSERIETASQQIPAAPAIDEIRTRLDQLQRAIEGAGQGSPVGLETTLRSLTEKLDASEKRLGNLGAIESGLNDLFAQLQEARASALEVAERAAKSAIREMAAPGAATSAAERSHRNSGDLETRYASSIQVATASPDPVRPEPRPALAAAQTGHAADLPDDLPADFPLEPGSGGPRGRPGQSAAQRIAQSEAALPGIAPKASDGPTRTLDFIAAARRAAQAAAAENPSETAKGRHKGPGKGIGAVFARGKRALLLALAAFLLIFTALRFYDSFLPALLPSEPANPVIEAPNPAEPSVSMPAPQNSSSLLDTEGVGIANVSPAGVIGTDTQSIILAESAIDFQATGAIGAAKSASAAVQTGPATAGLDTLAVHGGELPATIGNAALRTTALAGNPAAAYEIAARYFEGRGVSANMAEAVKWFERALAKGSAPAAYRLGSLHEKGQGVAKNHAEARRYYLIAAEAGHVRAMHNLAVLHTEGVAGKPDYRTAVRWFRMAADRGVRDSQYNLGVLYARGLGVGQNLAESFRWFSLAANQGDADAARKRDDVAKRLDVQTQVAARLAVQTWQALPADEAANVARLEPEWEKAETAPPPRKRSVKKSRPATNSSIDKDAWRQLMQ